MTLAEFWFVLIAALWIGFLVLEGFDFGVGMLHGVLGGDEAGRQTALGTIGPVWDGNEVWLIVAAAGMFAAFPLWYATMFSALYLAFLAVLVALMARGVALEFTTKSDDPAWRRRWRWALTGGSVLIPLLIGIGLGDLLHGLPVNSQHDYSGGLADLVTGYGLWTGATLAALCLMHGITFVKLRTVGPTRTRAQSLARAVGWSAIACVVGFVIWTRTLNGPDVPEPVQILALIGVVAAARLALTDHDGWAFAAS